MANNLRLEQFSNNNVEAYDKLTRQGDEGKLCYCSFWHQKFSMAEYDQIKRDDPPRLKACVIERMKANFHVGVIGYLDNKPAVWISVGPLIDFHWTWRRVGQLGDDSKNTAGIMCFTLAPEFRGKKLQAQFLESLKTYGKAKGWTAIEAYPFADSAIQKHGEALKWPGLAMGYERAGFKKLQNHWLSSPEAERFIYKLQL